MIFIVAEVVMVDFNHWEVRPVYVSARSSAEAEERYREYLAETGREVHTALVTTDQWRAWAPGRNENVHEGHEDLLRFDQKEMEEWLRQNIPAGRSWETFRWVKRGCNRS